MLKGLPDNYAPFVAVITQQERIHNFQKFKQALRNFEEIEKTMANKRDEVPKNTIMKTGNTFETPKTKELFVILVVFQGIKHLSVVKTREGIL